MTAPHLQKQLTRLLDCTRLQHLESRLQQQGNWEQLERLKDLHHPGTSRQWLWHLESKRGSVLNTADCVLSVRKRLGARVHSGKECCRLCGSHLDPQLEAIKRSEAEQLQKDAKLICQTSGPGTIRKPGMLGLKLGEWFLRLSQSQSLGVGLEAALRVALPSLTLLALCLGQ